MDTRVAVRTTTSPEHVPVIWRKAEEPWGVLEGEWPGKLPAIPDWPRELDARAAGFWQIAPLANGGRIGVWHDNAFGEQGNSSEQSRS